MLAEVGGGIRRYARQAGYGGAAAAPSLPTPTPLPAAAVAAGSHPSAAPTGGYASAGVNAGPSSGGGGGGGQVKSVKKQTKSKKHFLSSVL